MSTRTQHQLLTPPSNDDLDSGWLLASPVLKEDSSHFNAWSNTSFAADDDNGSHFAAWPDTTFAAADGNDSSDLVVSPDTSSAATQNDENINFDDWLLFPRDGLTIKIMNTSSELFLTIKRDVPLKKLMKASCKHFNLSLNLVRFLLDGHRTQPTDTIDTVSHLSHRAAAPFC